MGDSGEWQVVDRRAKERTDRPSSSAAGAGPKHQPARKAPALSPKEQYGARRPPPSRLHHPSFRPPTPPRGPWVLRGWFTACVST